jgi:hypothetical protein
LDRFYEPWVVGGISQGRAKLVDRSLETCVELNEGLVGPKPLAQLLSSYQVSRVFKQKTKYLEGHLLDFDSQSPFANLTSFQVDFK